MIESWGFGEQVCVEMHIYTCGRLLFVGVQYNAAPDVERSHKGTAMLTIAF